MSQTTPNEQTAAQPPLNSQTLPDANGKFIYPTPGLAGPPAITSIQPSKIMAGVPTAITIYGSNLPNSLAYSIANTDHQPMLGTSSQLLAGGTPTKVTLNFFTAADLTPGVYEILVQDYLGKASRALGIAGVKAPPVITRLGPDLIYVYQAQTNSLIVEGKKLPSTISGYSINCPGIKLQMSSPGSSTSILQLTIDPRQTPTGDYQLTAHTDAGTATATLHIINFAS